MPALPPASPDCCGRCDCYQRRDLDPVAAERARQAGFVVGKGHCRRFPLPTVKDESDWCAEWRPVRPEAK
jgi:hypothetical protein